MVPAAPRYDPRILDVLRVLDDRSVPIAETCRRTAAVAERLGLTRPSYVHMRRIVHEQRSEQDALRRRRNEFPRVLLEVGGDLLVGRGTNAYELAERIARENEREPR